MSIILIRALCYRNLVRHAAARVISSIASIEITNGSWPELLPFLNQCCTAPQASTREVGAYIIYTVLEAIVEAFQEYLPSLFKLFESLIQDPESLEVRVSTVKWVERAHLYLISQQRIDRIIARSLGLVAQYIDTTEKDDIVSRLHICCHLCC